jgi:putative membrane protein
MLRAAAIEPRRGGARMSIAASIAVVVVALLHVWFCVLEMFLWTRPLGLRTFGQSAEDAERTRVLAANQGLYNAFLAAGLLWGAARGAAGRDLEVFFLGCVVVAGVYGGLTASRSILVVQALPGLVALGLVLLAS